MLVYFLVVGIASILAGLSAAQPVTPAGTAPAEVAEIDLQGHRGARGLLPENSIPGFLKALDLGVTTLEMDVVITRDGEVLVSHEPWMSSVICRTPDGTPVHEDDERRFNIFELEYAETAAFDCGARGHPDFPDQRPTAVSKPLLRDVLRIADGYAHVTGREAPRFNVEIKSSPERDSVYHPAPAAFARIVYDTIEDEGVLERTTIQSFDPRSLRAVHDIDPSVSLALLVSNEDGFQANMRRLDFRPQVYSPNYGLVDETLMSAARASGVDVIPWTVNDRVEIERLLRLGVRGLITDYPDLGKEVIEDFQRRTE